MKHKLLPLIRNHYLPIVGYASLAVTALFLSLWMFWTFESKDVVEVRNIPVPARPQTINPESSVILSPDICKKKSVGATVRRSLVSESIKIQLPDYYNDLPKGCQTQDLAVIIPANTPDGTYHLEFKIDYQINPITLVQENWYSADFTVQHEPPLIPRTITVEPVGVE